MQRIVCAIHRDNKAAVYCIECETHQVACLHCLDQNERHFGHRNVSLAAGRSIAQQKCTDCVATVSNAQTRKSQADERWRDLNGKLLRDATRSVEQLDASIVKLIEQLEQVRVSLHTAVQRAAQTARSKSDKWSKRDKQKHTNTIRRATSWMKHVQEKLHTASVSELLSLHSTRPEVSECVGVDEQGEYGCVEYLNGFDEKIKDSVKAVAEGVHSLRELTQDLFVRPVVVDAANGTHERKADVLLVSGGSNCNSTYVFSPAASTWHSAACMSECRGLAAAALWNGKVVVAGGWNQSKEYLLSAEQYDPETNQWSAFKPMLTCRRSLALVNFDSSLFAIGGSDGKQSLNSVERYDAEKDEWSFAPALLLRRSGACAASFKNVIVVCGGTDGNSRLASCELLGAAVSQWKTCASLHTARSAASAVSHNDKFYVLGGWDGQVYLDVIEEYNYDVNMWTVLSLRLRVPRRFIAAAFANERVYLCAGLAADDTFVSDVDCFDVNQVTLTSVSPLPVALYGATAACLQVSNTAYKRHFASVPS